MIPPVQNLWVSSFVSPFVLHCVVWKSSVNNRLDLSLNIVLFRSPR